MGDIERVLVAGATGRTGNEILRYLEDTDLEVVALTRDDGERTNLLAHGADEVILGDLLDTRDAASAVSGCDAVLCAVGSGATIDPLLGRDIVDGQGVKNLVSAAVAAEVEAFVFESSIGVGDSVEMLPTVFRLMLGPILKAKNEAEAALRTSGLRYTIVRPGGLTDDPATEDLLVGEGGATVTGSIPRADVARLMVAALFTPEAENRTFEVVARAESRDTPRGLVELEWQFPERPDDVTEVPVKDASDEN